MMMMKNEDEEEGRLAIHKHAREILYSLERHQCLIVIGQTGSGKTTQICQILRENNWTSSGARNNNDNNNNNDNGRRRRGEKKKMICVTQPRRTSAQTIAIRVNEEISIRENRNNNRKTVSMPTLLELGDVVGCSVRFETLRTERTEILFATDGALLRELLDDPLLEKYSVIMVDEAHERSLNTDVLLGLLKKVMRRRRDLRVIVSSATIDAKAFEEFFSQSRSDTDNNKIDNNDHNTNESNYNKIGFQDDNSDDHNQYLKPAILSIEGQRQHPVRTFYLEEPTANYIKSAAECAMNIARLDLRNNPGDVLIFLTGEKEVEECADILIEQLRSERMEHECLICPLYAGLDNNKQAKAFRAPPRNMRKFIIATNIAETSVTIEGISFVIDSGFVKIKAFDCERNSETLQIVRASSSSAKQRAGRAGRVRPGTCFRLYPENLFNDLDKTSVPEIIRADVSGTILQLKALGIDNIAHFDWFEAPPVKHVVIALELLHALGAIDDDAKLTKVIGTKLAELPLEPKLGKALLAGCDYGCANEMLTICAYFSIGNTCFLAARRNQQSFMKNLDEAKAKFATLEGDGLTCLNVQRAYCWNDRNRKGFCEDNFLNFRTMQHIQSVRNQLKKHMQRLDLLLFNNNNNNNFEGKEEKEEKKVESILRSICAGFFSNAATLAPYGGSSEDGFSQQYVTVRNKRTVYVHQSSILYGALSTTSKPPQVIVYQTSECSNEGKESISNVSAVLDLKWFESIAGHFYEFN